MLLQKIKESATGIVGKVIDDRRYLHAHPELSFEEHNTAAYVESRLDTMGVPWKRMANTGIVALVHGAKTSRETIALRADMDALPITEANDVEYKSLVPGIMHACGHDAHTSSLLGTIMILESLKSEFGGTVKCIFQPGEEKLPGGASLMIKEGVLHTPTPMAVIGQHTMPSLPAGKIALRKGKHMASMDDIRVFVRGRGGHAAQPHQNIDPVLITAHIITALQQIVSRMANPSTPSVLSFGKVIANGAINVIPDEVYLEGTFRTMDETWRKEAHRQMKKMAETIAEAMGGSCEFNINWGYPVLVNNDALAETVQQHATTYLGKENVTEASLWMAAEDFAYYSQQCASCFYLLGVGNTQKGISSSLHTPTFNIDEDALTISTGLMAYIALKQLGN
jgi:amidohydrolase